MGFCGVVFRGMSIALLTVGSVALSQSFSLSATPQSITIYPGDKDVPVTVMASSSTYTGPIIVTLTGLPSGITVSPLTLTAGNSGVLHLSASVAADQEDFPAVDRNTQTANSPPHTIGVVGAVGSVLSSASFTLTVSISRPAFAPTASSINLPILRIDTAGTPITSKTVNVPGTMTITSADGQTSYLPNSSDSDNTATFHIHGNSTAVFLKKAYHVKLNTSLDLLHTMGLNCPYVTSSGKATCDKSKSYILLANFDDKTFLRDWSASALANSIPIGNGYLNSPPNSPSPSGTSTLLPWAPNSLFVELYLNGVYEGNYQLAEEIKVDSHRVNITELGETDTTDVTGGYLLEIDVNQGEVFNFITPKDVHIGIVDPDFTPDPEVPQQTSYISTYVNSAEGALFASNFTDPTLGWRAYFDEASTINFYLVNDLMGNQDGGSFYSSDYLYKDKDNPLLYMGPVWDFDISTGNDNYGAIVNPTIPWMSVEAIWYQRLFSDPGFKADVATQWNALKSNGVLASWLASIKQQSTALEQSEVNNFGRWPMLGIEVWPNPQAAGSYDGEVNYMVDWLNLRMAWMDSQLNNKVATTTALTTPTGTLRNGSPATLTAQVSGMPPFSGTMSFLSGGLLLGTGSLGSTGNASLAVSNLPVGTDKLEAVYSGDSTNGLSASTVQPVTVLGPLLSTVTSLASPASTGSGSSISFTAAVLGNSGTTPPTGMLTFTANGSTVGTASLSSAGTATFASVSLPGGNDTILAAYSGDSTYSPSSSNPVTVVAPMTVAATPVFSLPAGTYTSVQSVTMTDATPNAAIYYTTDGSTPTSASTLYSGAIAVNATATIQAIAVATGYTDSAVASALYTINLPPQTFTLAASAASATVAAGQSTKLTLTLTPQNGFSQAISFSCSGLPSGAACSFSPATVTPGNAAATTALTISVAGTSAALGSQPLLQWTKVTGGVVLALLVWPVRRRRALFAAILFLGAGLAVWGCGGSAKVTPPTTSTVTITATGGSVTQTQTLALTVTH